MLFKRGAKKQNNKPQTSANGSPRQSGAPKIGAPKPGVQPSKPQTNTPKPPVQPNRLQANMQKAPVQPNKPQANPQKPSVQPNKTQPNSVRKPTLQPNKSQPGITKAPAQNIKRKKFRGGNYSLYYILGAIILVWVFIILANTVLFKCASINVSGNDNYNSDEIIAASGINIGDNLVRLKTGKAEDCIVNSLAYIDEARVKKSFPTKINITVTEAEKQYCVVADGKTAAISRRGKIVELCEPGGLPVVKGYDPETLDVGTWLKSKTDGKSSIPADIFAAAEKAGLKNITVVDMSDKFNIEVTVENRVILKLGTSEDVVSKLLVAVEIIENQLGETEYVTLQLNNPEKVPVQNNSNPNKPVSSSSSKPASVSSVSTNPEEPVTPEEPEEPEDPEPEDPEDSEEPEDPDPEDPEDPEQW